MDEDERTNHEFLEEEASRPRARVVVLHRENDTAAGAQVEFNSYGSPFHFDVELARRGCSVVYPAAPQTRSRGAGAPLLRPASPPRRAPPCRRRAPAGAAARLPG